MLEKNQVVCICTWTYQGDCVFVMFIVYTHCMFFCRITQKWHQPWQFSPQVVSRKPHFILPGVSKNLCLILQNIEKPAVLQVKLRYWWVSPCACVLDVFKSKLKYRNLCSRDTKSLSHWQLTELKKSVKLSSLNILTNISGKFITCSENFTSSILMHHV